MEIVGNYLQVIFLNFLVIGSLGYISIDCPPAEEDKASILYVQVNKSIRGPINLIKNRESVLRCPDITHCEVFYGSRYNFSLSSNDTNTVGLIFTIMKISRGDDYPSNGIWSLIWLTIEENRIVRSCDLKVFAKSENIHCSKHFSHEAVNVICEIERIFPPAKCSFKVYSKEIVLDFSNDVLVKNEDYILNKLTYYRSKCTFSIKYKVLNPGTYTVSVNLYPDISGGNTDALYGLEDVSNFTIERPHIYLDGCPFILEEGELGQCHCKISNLPFLGNSSSIFWYNEKDQQIDSEDYGELQFIAQRSNSVFYCKANNTFGLSSFPKQYQPKVIIKSQNSSCKIYVHEDKTVQITCSTLKVYPAAKCVFAFKTHGINVQYQGDILYSHSKRDVDPMYFQSQCTQEIPKSSLTPGNYCVDITVYPDFNSLEIVASYGTKTSLHFFVGKPQNVTCNKKVGNDGAHITCIVGQVYPQAKCIFIITKSEVNIIYPNEVTYLHKPCEENPQFFTSECSLYLPNCYLSNGDYRVVNTMIPDDKDSLNIIRLSVTTSLHFRIEINEDYNFYIIISVIAGILLIVTLTTIVVLLRRKRALRDMRNSNTLSYKKRNQKTANSEEHVYETINEDTSQESAYQNVASCDGQQASVTQKMLEKEYITVID